MGRVVGARSGDDRRAAADRVHGRAEEVELLAVAERRRLAGRPADDDPVGAVLDEEGRKLAESLEVDCAVRPERRDHRGDDGTEHRGEVYESFACNSCKAKKTPSEKVG